MQWAARLDRVADAELAHGHVDAAERLSLQAAELRRGVRVNGRGALGATVDPMMRLRLERGCRHLHTLGPRATAELLSDVADRFGGMPAILDALSLYERRLTPAMIRATGGDRFPARPLRVVGR